jgi:hypothetical protein
MKFIQYIRVALLVPVLCIGLAQAQDSAVYDDRSSNPALQAMATRSRTNIACATNKVQNKTLV